MTYLHLRLFLEGSRTNSASSLGGRGVRSESPEPVIGKVLESHTLPCLAVDCFTELIDDLQSMQTQSVTLIQGLAQILRAAPAVFISHNVERSRAVRFRKVCGGLCPFSPINRHAAPSEGKLFREDNEVTLENAAVLRRGTHGEIKEAEDLCKSCQPHRVP